MLFDVTRNAALFVRIADNPLARIAFSDTVGSPSFCQSPMIRTDCVQAKCQFSPTEKRGFVWFTQQPHAARIASTGKFCRAQLVLSAPIGGSARGLKTSIFSFSDAI